MPDLPDGLRNRLPDGDRLRDRIRERSDNTASQDGDVGSRDAFDHKGGDATNDYIKHGDDYIKHGDNLKIGAVERDAFDHKGGDVADEYIKHGDNWKIGAVEREAFDHKGSDVGDGVMKLGDNLKVGAVEQDAFDHKADDMSWQVEEGEAWQVEEGDAWKGVDKQLEGVEVHAQSDDSANDLFVVDEVMDDPAAGLAPLDDGDDFQALPDLDAVMLDDSMSALGDDDGIDGL